MRRQRIAVAVGVVIGLAIALGAYRWLPRVYNAHRLREVSTRHPYDERADARALVAGAIARAASEHKRALVVMGGNWCQWCLVLDDAMEKDTEIRAYAESHYVVLHLDSEAARDLDDAWGHATKNGVPVLIFLDERGNVAHIEESFPLEAWGGRILAYDTSRVLEVLKRYSGAAT